ncbi:MAG: phosphoribosylformylglycinamidine cyclo-ligase [Thaumarchaeota archaeon]|nr:phosphoribosylformylglycinamidine cyclo-ligase [Nitrososphaerota archaeon]
MTRRPRARRRALTYRDAGVDIAAIERSRRAIGRLISSTHARARGARVAGAFGHYAGIVRTRDGTLVATHTDGVGTKVLVASRLRKYGTVGIDCVAMNVNDIVCVGATPVSFVDYIAASRNDTAIFRSIVSGLARGAREARVPIVGGETAIMPDLLRAGEFTFDLAGTVVGTIPPGRAVTGRAIRRGDVIIGARSSGLHSNGYSLARRALAGIPLGERVAGGRSLGDELLRPTRIYAVPALEVLSRFDVHGMAHITGGAFANLLRLKRASYEIDSLPRTPPIMELIRSRGVEDAEMYRTFNMGVGLCVIAAEADARGIIAALRGHGIASQAIGHVGAGSGVRVGGVDVA